MVRNLGGSGDILLDSPLNDADTIAIRNFATGFDILYLDATDITVGIAGQGVRTDFGDITLKAGTSITAAAELYAGQSTQLLPATVGTTIALIASSGITQTASQIVGNNLSVNNVTGAITLASLSNDIEQFAAVNTGGPVTYNDVNDFETGVTRTEAGLPLGYEVQTSGDLTLRAGAAGTPSTLRVVSGLRYGALTLTAGDSNTGAVGIVEYVTTSEGDNPPAPGSRGGFAGTLRDMITYANENKGRQTINGVAAVQPQLATFDELYYSVTDIVLSAGLPTIVQALSIDGERVEAQVTDYARVGISGSKIVSNSVVNGLSYGPGSGGSRVNGLALYGFRTGAGISLASGVNTVTNTFAGLQRDGTVDQGQRNLVGIDVTGRLATKNVIGNIITDDTTANVIGGNTFAGIVVRGGASSNAIVGNLIGTSAADDDVRNLGDGIRIDGSNTNTIGTRNSQRPDLTAALSNTIKYNGGSGIRITGAMAATRALGNAIENNLIDENGAHGIHIVSSAAQTVGGSLFNQANIIGNHIAVTPTPSGVTGAGIYLQSTAGSVITGNKIGVGSNFEAIGNSVGIRLQASTGNTINDGNQIGNNLGNGIELLQGSNANRVEGNYIGATINENTDLDVSSNGGGGILIQQSLANLVQGANLIANNAGTGISVVDSAAKNLQQGNFIGGNTVTNNGTASKGTAGILILGGGYQTIGGDAGGNTISLNNGDGIRVSNGSLTGASVGNVFTGNFVGTNKFHEDLLGNTGYGISITNGSKHVIAGNAVLNNGIDPTNESGTIEYDGIRIAGSSSNTVGSTLIGGGNIVGGNGGNGIVITDAVDVAGFGQVRIVANVARFTRAQTGKLRLNDVIVVDTSAYKITLIKNATTMNVTPVDGGPSDVALVDFQIRTAVANANNVVYGNSVADNTGNGIVVSGLRTNIVTVGQITIPGRAVGGAPNVIVGNGGYGVLVNGTRGVTIQGNSIAENGGLDDEGLPAGGGIQLINGANPGAVSPTIISATVEPGTTKGYVVSVQGTVAAVGTGSVSVSGGRATFTSAQTLAVNDLVVIGARGYKVTGRTSATSYTLAGAPVTVGSTFSILKANQVGQQYTIDLYLNQHWSGDAESGERFQAEEFLGRATVVIGQGASGIFNVKFNYSSETTPLGMFVTGTTTTTRPQLGTIQYSTSALSRPAAMVNLPGVDTGAGDPAASATARAMALAAGASSNGSTSGGSTSVGNGTTTTSARRGAFSSLRR